MHSYGKNKIEFLKGKDINYTLHTTTYIEIVVLPVFKVTNLKNGQKSCISHSFLSWALNTELWIYSTTQTTISYQPS